MSAVYAEPKKGLAIASLVLGILSLLTVGCLGIGALAGLVLGIMAVVKASREPDVFGGKGMAWAGIVTSGLGLLLLLIAGIIAAIAVPSLLRARVSANESATIGDTRTVISAQAAYQATNRGFYDGRLECLAKPAECMAGYEGPHFLDEPLAAARTKSGYRREFMPGPAVDTSTFDADSAPLSSSSVSAYAYVAWPEQAGQTGIRGFCGDATGVICTTADGRKPDVLDGACDLTSCSVLQ